MFQRLIKHTDEEHPDQKPLQEALKLVHDILLHLNCKEREALENDQREATLRELEVSIWNVIELNCRYLSVFHLRFNIFFSLIFLPLASVGRHRRHFWFSFKWSTIFIFRLSFNATRSRWAQRTWIFLVQWFAHYN